MIVKSLMTKLSRLEILEYLSIQHYFVFSNTYLYIYFLDEYRAEIITDSKFLYNCMTRDIFKWKNNGWMTNKGSIVANKYMLQKLDNHQNVMQEVTFVCYFQFHFIF